MPQRALHITLQTSCDEIEPSCGQKLKVFLHVWYVLAADLCALQNQGNSTITVTAVPSGHGYTTAI